MASYFILGLIEIFMLCFNEIKLKGGGLRGCRSDLKGQRTLGGLFGCFLVDEQKLSRVRYSRQTATDAGIAAVAGINSKFLFDII